MYESPKRTPLVLGDENYTSITDKVCKPVEGKPTKWWLFGVALSGSAALMGLILMIYTMTTGIGTWNLNKTIGWGLDITNFVFWVGIGHAGTLISAILLLFRQSWRTSINRSAEAMTIIAVACAGIFPVIHLGRPWLVYWFFPLPNKYGPLWVNFNSALLWDVFAISTYLIVSLVFWYIGLIPDLATLRDRAKSKISWFLYNFFSMGWTGSARVWMRFEVVALILAALATPLVLSVHTIVSFDFATSVIPGWHTTIFPPYFVAGAIFSGFAMVHTLLVVARKTMGMENYITITHLENMAKVIVVTGLMVGLAYAVEFFVAWYSEYKYEYFVFINRATGPYAWAYWTMITCNVVVSQFFWSKTIRTTPVAIFIISIFINIGMWFERFVIIVTSLHRDFLPSSWAMYLPNWIELGTFIGTLGIFFFSFLLFAKFLPVIAIAEVKSIMKPSRRGKPKEKLQEENK